MLRPVGRPIFEGMLPCQRLCLLCAGMTIRRSGRRQPCGGGMSGKACSGSEHKYKENEHLFAWTVLCGRSLQRHKQTDTWWIDV